MARQRLRGPAGEVPWWDPIDQAWAEDLALPRRSFGRGWLEVAMVNNAERHDPLAGPASGSILAARAERRLVALDEGRAWRRRDGALAVLRVEVYASDDDRAHRSAWKDAATAALEETWAHRWRERGREAGWVEASPVPAPSGATGWDDRVDWLHLEDHTEAAAHDAVTAYEHLVVWLGRAQATLTIRHLEGLDLDHTVVSVANALAGAPPPGP